MSEPNHPTGTAGEGLHALLDAVAPYLNAVENHPLYGELTSLDRLQRLQAAVAHARVRHHSDHAEPDLGSRP